MWGGRSGRLRGAVKFMVNGKPHAHQGNGALKALLRELGVKPGSVAVMVNGSVVTRGAQAKCMLKAGDAVELLTFAGGG